MMPTLQAFARPVRRRISMSIPREYDGYSFEVILVPVKPEPKKKYDLSCFFGKAKLEGDAVEFQRSLRDDDLMALAGTWVEDPAMDKALVDMDTIDGELWK